VAGGNGNNGQTTTKPETSVFKPMPTKLSTNSANTVSNAETRKNGN